MSFAENLQFLRKRERITQEELADFLQVSRQSVSKWETGEAYPETEKLITLCDKFGVTLDALLRGDLNQPETDTVCSIADDAKVENERASVESSENDAQTKCECASVKTATNDADGCKKCEGERKKSKSEILGDAFGGFIMLSCVIAYLCMGFTANLWHPGWLVFLAGITLCTFLGSFFANDGDHDDDEDEKDDDYQPNYKERLFGGLAAASMMAATVVYLCLGFFLNLWHPGWVCFIAGGALASIFGGLAHYFSTKEN